MRLQKIINCHKKNISHILHYNQTTVLSQEHDFTPEKRILIASFKRSLNINRNHILSAIYQRVVSKICKHNWEACFTFWNIFTFILKFRTLMTTFILLEKNNYWIKWHLSSEIYYYLQNLAFILCLALFSIKWVQFPVMKKGLDALRIQIHIIKFKILQHF